jgi:glycosyltransferase involved in cell wall biosynthesis
MSNDAASPKISVYVHLAYGFSAERFKSLYDNGKLIGINEPYAYGYYRAENYGCVVKYSTDHAEGKLIKLLRYAARAVLGFDLVHAFRNRRNLFGADFVWTHTESQSLAVAAVLRLKQRALRPKSIFQSVWLIDQWERLNPIHRYLYRRLLSQSDVLTFLSALNQARAKLIFPDVRTEHVFFGIRVDELIKSNPAASHPPIRVLAVGNDRHRDWETLRSAVLGNANIELRVITGALPRTFLTGNAAVLTVNHNAELLEHYRWADIAVVPLKPNLHASGITAIQEAILQGIPVISTNVGGLEDYFGQDAVCYVEAKDPIALRQAIEDLYADPQRRSRMVERAQSRMVEGPLNSDAYVRRHVELSRAMT